MSKIDALPFSKAAYATVDLMQGELFAKLFTPNGRFTFGNAPTVTGREAIVTYVDTFFSMIKGIRHNVTDAWRAGDTIVSQFTVNYIRKDDSHYEVPALTLWTMQGGLIDDYRIYIDNHELFNPQVC